MSIDFAEKYSAKIDERFKLGMLTAGAVNNDYDFVGVKTVNVYSVPVVAMGNYTRSGANRYGNPSELEPTAQEMTLSKDRAFTFTIDRGNLEDAMLAQEAGRALQRQIDEVVIPEIDVYRLSVMATNAKNSATTEVTSSNAYSVFLDGVSKLTDEKVPLAGRIAYVSPNFYKLIKLDDAFVKAGDLAQDMLIKGQVGMIDGVAIILVPTSYLPEDVQFIITHASAVVSPIKIAEYKVHDNAPGISGYLVEGRVYYDAFALNNKKGAIYKHANP